MKTNPPLNKLKSLRKEKSLSVREIAKMLGMSKSMYSFIENGDKRLSYDDALNISEIFNMNPDELFYEDYKEFFKSTHI